MVSMAGFSTAMLEAAGMRSPETAQFWQRVLDRLREIADQDGVPARKRGPSWLHDQTKLSLTSMANYRKGEDKPSQQTVVKVAEVVGKDAEWLYPGYTTKLVSKPEDGEVYDAAVEATGHMRADAVLEQDERVETDVRDYRWRDAVRLYLKSDDGIDTPGYVVPDLLDIPYRHFHLRPDVLADVHTARQLLQRQLAPAPSLPKTVDRPDIDDAIEQPKAGMRIIAPRIDPKGKR